MQGDVLITNQFDIQEAANKLVYIIHASLIFNNVTFIDREKEALLKIKVQVVGIIEPRVMSTIKSLEMVLDNWIKKRKIVNATLI